MVMCLPGTAQQLEAYPKRFILIRGGVFEAEREPNTMKPIAKVSQNLLDHYLNVWKG
jgi:hypothetical protein